MSSKKLSQREQKKIAKSKPKVNCESYLYSREQLISDTTDFSIIEEKNQKKEFEKLKSERKIQEDLEKKQKDLKENITAIFEKNEKIIRNILEIESKTCEEKNDELVNFLMKCKFYWSLEDGIENFTVDEKSCNEITTSHLHIVNDYFEKFFGEYKYESSTFKKSFEEYQKHAGKLQKAFNNIPHFGKEQPEFIENMLFNALLQERISIGMKKYREANRVSAKIFLENGRSPKNSKPAIIKKIDTIILNNFNYFEIFVELKLVEEGYLKNSDLVDKMCSEIVINLFFDAPYCVDDSYTLSKYCEYLINKNIVFSESIKSILGVILNKIKLVVSELKDFQESSTTSSVDISKISAQMNIFKKFTDKFSEKSIEIDHCKDEIYFTESNVKKNFPSEKTSSKKVSNASRNTFSKTPTSSSKKVLSVPTNNFYDMLNHDN